MRLPTGVKYRTAVQNPEINFRDPDLAKSTAECDTDGIPLTYSGGFATTFRMRDGGATWAVRCFTSPVVQLEQRYGIISRYIATKKPRFFVKAALLRDAIQCDLQWYPIVKMDWLSGYTLNSYIETQLQAASKIIKMRDELALLAEAMQARTMAHGDLQHGNIIVSNGRPRLVDYDGIFLPELKGIVSEELGHKHYQHPLRALEDWGPHMDRFSQIALHVGLSAIAQRRDLWNDFNNGENVLFTKSDFADPAASELFDELSGIGAMERMSEDFRELCAGPLKRVPTLQHFVARTASANGSRARVETVISVVPEDAGPTLLAATDRNALLASVGSEVTVRGVIAGIHQAVTKYGKPYLFLSVGVYPSADFTFKIWSDGLAKYEALGLDPASWVGEEVQVQGTVGLYEHRPEMTIYDPAQLRILG